MSDEGFTCSKHRAFIYERGGTKFIGELTPLSRVQWGRIRDDISNANATVPTTLCCELLAQLRCVFHELHIARVDTGDIVWQGPITRLEYEYGQVQIFAQDVMWVASRTVLQVGYDQSYPAVGDVVDRMDWLVRDQCFAKYGDPWNVVPYLHPINHPDGPRTTRQAFSFQLTVWEDFDKYAEDMGADYTVVGRDVFYFDQHLAWSILPDLSEDDLSQFPRIVEYGVQLATRTFVTNGKGFAGMAVAPDPWAQPDVYGYIDALITNQNEEATSDAPPSAGELAEWQATAERNLRYPTPASIVVPANSTLMPGAPWTVRDLIPGSWFQVSVTRLCRQMVEWQRLHEVRVTESAPNGETVQITTTSPPAHMVLPE